MDIVMGQNFRMPDFKHSMQPIVVSGVGACVVDKLYPDVDFGSEKIKPYLSKKNGDGGLVPEELVNSSTLEKFTGKTTANVIQDIVSDQKPVYNIGGSSIVSLIHMS